MPAAVSQWIADLPQLTGFFFVFDFEVRHRGAEHRIPVDEPFAAIDQAIVVEPHKRFEHRGGEPRVHGKAFTRPVPGGAEPAHLVGDGRARRLLPLPNALDELLAAELLARLTLRFDLILDDDL